MWINRCYFDGIPDEVPNLLSKSGRVPSYKDIALCILKNDHNLIGLGFSVDESDLVKNLRAEKKRKDDSQLSINWNC